ncbi:MAG: YbaB/EbfC family nucleoid-associated protein [Treponema sp.]|jgi:DNA-binding YbaB/EbfC family protein|nr:YbaB/EbfC family nucleoid-associated protein [Treponema sp.]
MNINPFDILKNAQKIQEQMGSIQEKLKDIKVTGSSGGGMVEVDLDGRMEMSGIRISRELLEDGDSDMLQDLIIAAYNSAMGKLRENLSQEMGALAGLPAGFTI